uniref:CHK domain-containing protein n=1 Tax=Strongyloides venezuelensis TaxID=75913 RepID=A0A0K0FS85_STRVS
MTAAGFFYGFDISDGKGFLSKVFKTSIYFDDEKKVPYYVILKIPGDESIKEILKKQNLDGTMNIELEHISVFHNKECHFYNDVASKIKTLKYPKCYGSKDLIVGKQEGALLIKFLGSDSVIVPFYRSLNIHQTKSILNEAYKLQEHSLLNQDDFIKDNWEQPFTEDQMKSFLDLARKGIPTLKKYILKEMWSEIENDLDNMISNYIKIMRYVYIELPKSNGNVPVICHGDMWINNFMFKVNSNEYNVLEESDYIGDARMFDIGTRVYYNLYDAINICKELHPEWLKNSK